MKLSKEQVYLLEEYMFREFDNIFKYNGENIIGLAYTQMESEEELFGIEVNLIVDKRTIETLVNEEVLCRTTYDSEEALNSELKHMGFDDLIRPAVYFLEENYDIIN